MVENITIIGAGLAGSEAAWQAAQRGIKVRLYEMRPHIMTPAHETGFFAELVCSNSLRADRVENAVGLLKEEMRLLDSLIIKCADENRLPAGGALAVDRQSFSRSITKVLEDHPNIEIVRKEVTHLEKDGIIIIASGPLTSPALNSELISITGMEFLYFYDAAAPIIENDTIDYEKTFWASRYDKGEADYLNCPMNQNEYEEFYHALITAEVTPLREFEKEIYFEGCMPIEVMASRGPQTLLFGPLKPVGLIDPLTQARPYAVVQLRKDNAAGTLFNMVGFQTHLKWNEQKRVFRKIPGLSNAEFARLGTMHRNTFINSPILLLETAQFKSRPNLLIAGQISGVEGYVESAASGLLAGINAARLCQGLNPFTAPPNSALGSLMHYITHAESDGFQPMNITFGLLPPLDKKIRDKKAKNMYLAHRALDEIKEFIKNQQ